MRSALARAPFTDPGLDFKHPLGIDVLKVVLKNITPFIDTGVAHKDPGVGQVGAGVVQAPPEPFMRACEAFADLMDRQRSSFASSTET